jgi:hypothetical protein
VFLIPNGWKDDQDIWVLLWGDFFADLCDRCVSRTGAIPTAL